MDTDYLRRRFGKSRVRSRVFSGALTQVQGEALRSSNVG